MKNIFRLANVLQTISFTAIAVGLIASIGYLLGDNGCVPVAMTCIMIVGCSTIGFTALLATGKIEAVIYDKSKPVPFQTRNPEQFDVFLGRGFSQMDNIIIDMWESVNVASELHPLRDKIMELTHLGVFVGVMSTTGTPLSGLTWKHLQEILEKRLEQEKQNDTSEQ